MFKLYKKLSVKDFIFVILIIGLTVLSVYFTMELVDGIQDIIQAITYVNYHNNPESLFTGDSAAMLAVYQAGGWDAVLAMVAGTPLEATIKSIADAGVSDIWMYGGIILAYAAGSMVVQGVIAVLASFVAADLTTRIRTDLYEQIEKFSLAEIDKFSTASLVTRTTNDLQQIQFANLLTMRMIFQAPITCIWAIVKFQNASSNLSLASIIGIIIIVLVIGGVMIFALPKFKKMQKLTDNINNVTRDNLTGIRIVRAYNAEKFEEEKFEKANDEFTRTQIFTGRAMAILSPVIMIVMNGLSLAIYLIGANLINSGNIDYASVVSSVMLSSQIIMSFMMILMLFIMWPRALVGAQRINEVLETKPSIVDPENPVDFKEKGTIEFKNVDFKYPGAEGNVVNDISFKVDKGETLAIIGATSSGKSTIVNMISRLYDATSGEVLIDGVNVKDVNAKDLRDRIGFVPQKGFLFNGSIADNISFGSDEKNPEKIKFAAQVACAEEFIEAKDDKYESMISQGGKNVSGGQRQRLCIARCVYLSPEIYVFDDSFSALDYKTDKQVRENLNNLDKDATKVIVAQRIGTIMDADKIIVLDEGKIVGLGKHEELLRSCEIYREIALSQLTREELGL
ncbi:MAG: ABC transporter ATP-binding protein/permease [Acholeplasmatales bacterium]|nr:ABC transporter ATP-binding protein/permease [Acholeplasmatales bacterium]